MQKNLTIAVLAAMTVTACAAEDYSDRLLIDGIPLESMCLSENEDNRAKCVDRIRYMLDRPDRLTACYMSELLTLQTVGSRGYREILELMEWQATPEGKARTATVPTLVRATRKLTARIEPARDTIRRVRESGKIGLGCRLVLALQGK